MPMRQVEGVRIYIMRPIDRDVSKAVIDAARKLFKLTDVRKLRKVQVVPATVVEGPDGNRGFGVFAWPPENNSRRKPYIVLGGQAPDKESESMWPVYVVGSLAHELAHFEQWRDGKAMTERGVRVRARNLLLRAGLSAKGI